MKKIIEETFQEEYAILLKGTSELSTELLNQKLTTVFTQLMS